MDFTFGMTMAYFFFFPTDTDSENNAIGGSRSVNDLCVDILQIGRHKLLSSPYIIPKDEIPSLLEQNNNIAKRFHLDMSYLQLNEFKEWQPIILPVRYVVNEEPIRVYYNLPCLIFSILKGQLTTDPITGVPIVSKRPDNITIHQTLYVEDLMQEHIQRQLSIIHHMFHWAYTHGKTDVTSFLLSNIPYVDYALQSLKIGSNLFTMYQEKQVDINKTVTIEMPLQELNMDNITTIGRIVPSQLYLEPYAYVIRAHTRERSPLQSIPKPLMRIHRSAYKVFKTYMKNFSKPNDFLTSCRDEPTSPKGIPPSKR